MKSQTQSANLSARKEGASAAYRLSSAGIPEKDRAAILNRALEKSTFGSFAEALTDQPIRGALIQRKFPDLDLLWSSSTPLRAVRTKPLFLADGSDSILLSMATAPRISVQFGKEYSLAAGEAMITGNTSPGSATYPTASKQLSVIVSQKSLRPLLREKSAHFLQVLPSNSDASQLLVGYLNFLKDVVIPLELEQAVVAHVHDLIAITIGATRDGVEIAKTRGVRAARRYAIKRDVINGLRRELSIDAVAAQHRLTPRYVQMLFEDEGMTFTEFVRNQRLNSVRSMLLSPRFDDKSISEIAFDAGFSDLSYFNRAFRRRFGMSPSDARGSGERTGN